MQKQSEYNKKNREKNRDLGLVPAPRVDIPKKYHSMLTYVMRALRDDYLRNKK